MQDRDSDRRCADGKEVQADVFNAPGVGRWRSRGAVEASVFLAGKRSLAAEDADHRLRTHHDVGRQELFQIISHEGEATGCRMSDDAEAMSAASWAGISAKIIYWLQVSIEVRSAGAALWLTQTYVSSINRTRSMLPWRRADDLPEGSPPC